MGIKTIIFDLGNTVINFDHRIAVNKILPFTDKTPEEIFNLFFDSGVTERFETGKITPAEFFQEVRQMLNLKLEFDEFVPIWNEIFSKNPEIEKIVKALKEHYRLVLVSNINELHMRYIKEKFDIIKAFDAVVTSYEAGSRKPEKLIYNIAQEEARCLKDELVYTDDRQDLIEASLALGIPSVHFKNAQQLKEDFKKMGIVFNGA